MALTPEERAARKAAKPIGERKVTPEARAARKAAKGEAGGARKTANPEARAARKAAAAPGGRRKGADSDAQAARAARKAAKAAAAPTGTATELRDVIYMVSRVAGSFESLLKTKEPALSLSQWAMLETVAQETETIRPSQLGRKLASSRQLIRQSAKKLIKLQLIEAEAPEEGKKAIGLKATDAGKAVLDDIGASTIALSAALVEDKPDFKVGQTSRVLRALSSAIIAQLPKKEKAEIEGSDDADGGEEDTAAAIELA